MHTNEGRTRVWQTQDDDEDDHVIGDSILFCKIRTSTSFERFTCFSPVWFYWFIPIPLLKRTDVVCLRFCACALLQHSNVWGAEPRSDWRRNNAAEKFQQLINYQFVNECNVRNEQITEIVAVSGKAMRSEKTARNCEPNCSWKCTLFVLLKSNGKRAAHKNHQEIHFCAAKTACKFFRWALFVSSPFLFSVCFVCAFRYRDIFYRGKESIGL